MKMERKLKRDCVPLTQSQIGLYMDWSENPASMKYNVPFFCRLPEGTDKTRFIEAVRTVVKHHPALFAEIRTVQGSPSMVYAEKEIVVEETEADSIEKGVEGFLKPFDLENGPLFHFRYLHTKEGDAFLSDIHHIVFDGASLHTFFSQIFEVYGGAECPDEEISFFDIAFDAAGKDDPEKTEKFRKMFAEKLDGLECDPRPISDLVAGGGDNSMGRVSLCTSDCTPEAVNSYLSARKLTENALFQSVFGYTLTKFNGAKETVYTTAFHGRTKPSEANVIGMFVRTLPMRCSFDEDTAPEDFIRTVSDYYYQVKQNDCVPFAEIAADYGVSTDISFIYHADLLSGIPFGGSTIELEDLNDEPIADIEFLVMKKPDCYKVTAKYRKSCYSEELMLSFIHTYISVLRGMITAEKLGDIELIDKEGRALLDSFNRTEKPYDTEHTVVDLFREQVRKTPDALCLAFKEKHFTYAEIDKITDNLAAHLSKKGIGKGSVVGVLIPRCEYMLTASLGVLKAGAAYLPLDPGYPPERLNLMVEDAEATLLITTPELQNIITDSFKGERMMVSEIDTLPDADKIPQAPDKEDIFIMLYTSGSTGKPKGVLFKHSNTMVTAAWERDFYALGPGCNVTAYASYGFDANVFDTYATITSGAALHIIADDIRLDLLELQKYFNENSITHSTMTTQVGRQFALMEGTKTLRSLSVAGEKLTPLEPPKDFALYNLYGPTEGSILATGFRVDRLYRDIPIGKAIDNVKLYVVDPCGRLLPVGAAGELWLSGAHVTKGYKNNPEKTAAAYGENPFSTEPGYDRVYRTGDIVRMLPDGNIQFVGRRDGQVKVRGFRVELTEIEEVIRRFEGIKDVTVAAFDEEGGGKFVAAYIVSDTQIDIQALNAFIRSEKPYYMVPAVTMQIEKIPLNQNQKVDKKALPYPVIAAADDAVPPETETQKKIFDIVAEVIGHSAFGIDTDLFETGLTSIGMLKLNVMLGKAFDLAIKLSDLKQHGTVRQLESMILSAERATDYGILADYPITQTQKGIFTSSSIESDSVTYNIPQLFKLSTEIDILKLADAIKAAIDAHPYLKALLFADETGDIRAKRDDSAEVKVDIIECENIPDKKELVRPYTLIGEPLYRARIYKTPHDNYLFIDMHHIVSDGTSAAILLTDIDKAYSGKILEKERYGGFEAALDEEKARSSERYEQAKAYYDGIFKGCETDCLPPKSPEEDGSGSASFTLTSKTGADKAKDFCDKNALTLNAFFNTAFGFTLNRFSLAGETVFATIYNGRNNSRLASAVTMLVKTLPVMIRPANNKKVVDFIRETQEQLMGSMANDLYSFAEISASYGIRSDIIFAYQGDNFAFDTICGKPAEAINVLPDAAKAPIAVTVDLRNGKFVFNAEYRRDMYSAPFMHAFVEAFDETVSSFIEKTALSDVSMLSESAEKELMKMNDTKREFKIVPVNKLFEEHVEAHPDKTAVISDGKRLTYGELNGLANRIARALIKRGVKKDTIVAMMIERSVYIPVLELGIMKAGGAFLGVLTSYPDDRIDFCMRDGESPFIITTEAIKTEKTELFSGEKPYFALTIEEILSEEKDETNPDLDIPMDSLLYCIYTSGSTGKPKGVLVDHRSFANLVQQEGFSYSYMYGKEGGDVCLALSSISFDMSVMDDLVIILNGRTVSVATEHEIHNPAELSQMLIENHVDIMFATPSFIVSYLDIPEFRKALAGFRSILLGAEAFPAKVFDDLRTLAPNANILNGYGPTECTITCSAKKLDSNKNITIGSPIANSAFYVLDRFGHVLPPYACGELIICGECVGRGYVKLPEKTAAAFFTLNGMPAYHSGDTVRLNKDGEVEFFGRIDNQVKLRGFRVELDEIENRILTFTGVKRAKVVVRNNGSEDYLAAFFTADHAVDTVELTNFLKSSLTYYMVPDVLMQLETMPLTPNGKIDKKALPEVRIERKRSGKKQAKKSLEAQLCELFASVLSLDEVFADDNFFEMGGTSLSASKVIMRLLSKGVKVEYQNIFDYPTPETLAMFIESSRTVQKEEAASKEEEKPAVYEQLKHNTLKEAAEVRRESIGDVLLSGCVGFLGIHILRELIDRREGKIVCLLRKGNAATAEKRLKNMLMYYFDKPFDAEIEEFITVVEADITDDSLSEKLKDIRFDTIINSAALVKHYASDDSIERVNVHGVENLIKCAKEHNAKMIQISTTSIPGAHTADTYQRGLRMHENELYVIDALDNKYLLSKYHAELKVLAAVRDGLRGKIMRVGNLMGRHSDGEFQINSGTNAFLNAIRGFAAMCKYPMSHATDPMRLSPIDLTAKAIVLLAGTNDDFTAFNVENRFNFDSQQMIDACNRCGVKIEPASDEEFYAEYMRLLADEKMNSKLSGLITNDRPDMHMAGTDNTFTTNILYRLGFSWPLVDDSYLDRIIESLKTLDYFDDGE